MQCCEIKRAIILIHYNFLKIFKNVCVTTFLRKDNAQGGGGRCFY